MTKFALVVAIAKLQLTVTIKTAQSERKSLCEPCSLLSLNPSYDSPLRISDVQDFVARCQRSCPPFVLTTSLPFRELSDKELSLEEADLAHAVIVQRPLNTQALFGHS